MLVELSYTVDDAHDVQRHGDVDAEDQVMIRGFLAALVEKTGVSMEGSRAMFSRTAVRITDTPKDASAPDFLLATLYMDMLRGSRG
jgi:hypothetical protein